MNFARNATLSETRALVECLIASGNFNQSSIARGAGVDQSTVSRLTAGKKKRVAKAVKRIFDYASMQIREAPQAPSIKAALQKFTAAGGDPDLLCAQIDLLIQARTQRV